MEGFVRIRLLSNPGYNRTSLGACGQVGRTGPVQSMCSSQQQTQDMLRMAKPISSVFAGAQVLEVRELILVLVVAVVVFPCSFPNNLTNDRFSSVCRSL